MLYLIALFITIVIVCPISIYLAIGKVKDNKKDKKSNVLFNATQIERNVTEEEIFNTLDKEGITIDFLRNM